MSGEPAKAVPGVPAPAPSGDGMRPLRSFVLRQGRMTPAQQRGFELYWQSLGIDPPGRPLDLDQVFGRSAPRVLEIGFGNGEALLECAQREPERDFLGIEVHGPGVGRVLNGAGQAGLRNLRVLQHDAVEVLRDNLAPGSLDEVRIWFPDPWPKKRHHKRRLVQPAFVALLRGRVRGGARLHLATDWPAYAAHMLEVMEAAPGWRNLAGPGQASPRPPWRPLTHFEQRGLRLGHPVADLLYEAVDA